jgi:hypothetical protein
LSRSKRDSRSVSDKSLLPAATAIGAKLAPAFERWATLLEEHGPGMAKIVGSIAETFLRVPDVAVWAKGLLDKIPVIFDLKAHWPTIQKFFTDRWANTQREFEALWPIISKFGSDLWTNTLKEWERLSQIVAWDQREHYSADRGAFWTFWTGSSTISTPRGRRSTSR